LQHWSASDGCRALTTAKHLLAFPEHPAYRSYRDVTKSTRNQTPPRPLASSLSSNIIVPDRLLLFRALQLRPIDHGKVTMGDSDREKVSSDDVRQRGNTLYKAGKLAEGGTCPPICSSLYLHTQDIDDSIKMLTERSYRRISRSGRSRSCQCSTSVELVCGGVRTGAV
jgi:hypothetical protein